MSVARTAAPSRHSAGRGCADSQASRGQESSFTFEAAGGHVWPWRPVIFDLAGALRELEMAGLARVELATSTFGG